MRPSIYKFQSRNWACLLALTGLMVVAQVSPAHCAVTYEVPRPGPARALRLIDAAGRPLDGSLSQPRWELKGNGLFFTREFGGTRNVWRAFPDPQDNKRYPTWRALPVTNFKTPVFAASAVPMPGSKALLLVSNAGTPSDPNRPAQIARFDLRSADLKPVTTVEDGAFDPAVSLDGQSLAYASTRGGTTSVYVQSLGGGAPRRVALNARRPSWQDNSSLFLESVGNPTIFRLSLSDASRPTRMSGGEQITVAKDGAFLAFGSSSGNGAAAQMRLFLMAGDGSGLRAITDSSTDARRPALAPDGLTLAFDAPLPGEGQDRAIWVMPLERGAQDTGWPELPLSQDDPAADDSSHRRVVENPQTQGNARLANNKTTRLPAPSAQITGVEAASRGSLIVWGTANGEQATATLEFGAGTQPSSWTSLPVNLPLKSGAPLGQWTPPSDARGIWTIRLTVNNEGGAAMSLFNVPLPMTAKMPRNNLPAPTPLSGGPSTGDSSPTVPPSRIPPPSGPLLPSGGPLPRAPLPELPVAPLPVLPQPAPYQGTPYKLAPAPAPRQSPLPKPAPRPTTPHTLPPSHEASGGQNLPPTFPAPNLIPPPLPAGHALPPVIKSPPVEIKGPPVGQPPVVKPAPAPAPVQAGGHDAATFNISGTLATMAPNQTMKVTFWGLNKGDRAWDAGSAGQSSGAVRLVARWVDFDSGNRRKWSLQWMKTTVVPGDRASWDFDVKAPANPGHFKLIYGLVRTPDGKWEPPAYNARQESWPNEFAAIAFAVTVK